MSAAEPPAAHAPASACAAAQRERRPLAGAAGRLSWPRRSPLGGSSISPNTPHREVYWNIDGGWMVYVFLGALVSTLLYVPFRRSRLYRLGRKDLRTRPHRRAAAATRSPAAQPRTACCATATPRIYHTCIYSSIIVLTIVTTLLLIDHEIWQPLTGEPFLRGPVYLGYKLVGDIFGVIGLVGVAMAVWRRYVAKKRRLQWDVRWEDQAIIGLLGYLLLSGFVQQGLRIGAPDAASPLGSRRLVALGAGRLAGRQADDRRWAPASTLMRNIHRILWWTHMTGAFLWLSLIAYTKLGHIVLAPANGFFKTLEPYGRLTYPTNLLDENAPMAEDAGLRRREAAGPELEAALRDRRLRALRPLHRRLPVAHRRSAALADVDHPERQDVHERVRAGDSRCAQKRGLPEPEPSRPLVGGAGCARSSSGPAAPAAPACRSARSSSSTSRRSSISAATWSWTRRRSRRRRRPRCRTSSSAATPGAARSCQRTTWMDIDGGAGVHRRAGVPVLGGLHRCARGPQRADHAGDHAPADGGRRQLRRARRAGDLQRRPGAPAGQRVPLPDAGAGERRAVQGAGREEGHHPLPALLQHLRERVPRLRRQVRGHPSLGLPAAADRAGEAEAEERASARRSPSTTPAISAATTASTTRRATC